MMKALFVSTWTSCWKTIRIIPFLADSGAFVTGVLAALHYFQMNWEIGVSIVVIGLAGIGALVNRFERSASLNQDERMSANVLNNRKVSHSSRQASEVANRNRVHVSTQANRNLSRNKSDRSLQLKIAMGKFRVEIISTRIAVRAAIGRKQFKGIDAEIRQEDRQRKKKLDSVEAFRYFVAPSRALPRTCNLGSLIGMWRDFH